MVQIEKESTQVVAPKQEQIREEEAVANKQALEAQSIKDDCGNDLAEALPILAKAQAALNTIKPAHINEIKHLGKPPAAVTRVLQAVCVLCQRKAERTPKKENPKELEDNWWYTAQKFMAEKDFLPDLIDFDKDNIPVAAMRKIREKFIPDPDFKPERVEKASFAAKGLCLWVRALDKYDKVVKMVAPKRARAKEAEAKYAETLEGLAKKQAELRGIVEQFEGLQAKLAEAQRHK
jgi:dynein heavy chain